MKFRTAGIRPKVTGFFPQNKFFVTFFVRRLLLFARACAGV